jgi:hypothetical protein
MSDKKDEKGKQGSEVEKEEVSAEEDGSDSWRHSRQYCIADEQGICVGTGFFIHQQSCVTCHYNICRLNEIYIEREEFNIERGQQRKRRYHGEWVEVFSDMQEDIY